jgi:cytochrome bd ubiquinol oxidase subunit I
VVVVVLAQVCPLVGDANAAGWIFTEMGRQPFVVYPNPDVPRADQVYFFTASAVSPGVTAAEVLTSLIGLGVLYGALAVVELWLITRFVRREPPPGMAPPPPALPPRARRTRTSPAAGTTSCPSPTDPAPSRPRTEEI